jgi:hypothetical protein
MDGALGMFAPIYWALAQPSKLHPQMTMDEVDALDVWVAAIYLGIRPADPDDEFGPLTGDLAADAAALNRRRMEEHARRQVEAAAAS